MNSESAVHNRSTGVGQKSPFYMPGGFGNGQGLAQANFHGRVVIVTSTADPSTGQTARPTSSPMMTSSPTVQQSPQYGKIFDYTGTDQTTTINSHQIRVYLWGAGGGGAVNSNDGGCFSPGGAGAYVEGVLDITPPSVVTVIVGQGGGTSSNYGGGGAGAYSGGGRSALVVNGQDIVTAGGGGGGGNYNDWTGLPGGGATVTGISYQGCVGGTTSTSKLGSCGGGGGPNSGGIGSVYSGSKYLGASKNDCGMAMGGGGQLFIFAITMPGN